ncbi:unnamed protein product [Oppiella nova]|uniref:C2H2-type domain-containing protein n=1 Tax=Oppiella nova TaxID=334625 RepID=A0A7R9MLD1_9ACAR|nr:unnamed protein product [Oppiella nova]CAG2179554.1 unnamed protein product [Oppiella nova]
MYTTISDLNVHKNAIHSNVRYVCDWSECRKQFTRKQYLLQHKSSVHLNERQYYKCNEENCGKQFTRKTYLNIYLNIMNKIVAKIFKLNGDSFNTKKFILMKNHMFVITMIVAKGCNEYYSDNTALKQHIIGVHMKGKPVYQCSQPNCGQVFKKKCNLYRHNRCLHLQLKPFKCNEHNCGKSFPYQSDLNRHQKRMHKN